MTDKSRQCLDKGDKWSITNWSFDYLLYDLLIVELATYGFDYDS